jgi:hypothetical protein
VRRAIVAIALAACGSREHAKPPPAPADAQPAPSDGLPPAAILIDRDGSLRVVATHGRWADLRAVDLAKVAPVTTPAALVDAVLAIERDAGGEIAAAAAAYTQELAKDPDRAIDDASWPAAPLIPRGDAPQEIDVTVTYASLAAEPLPPTTPLIVVDPAAPALSLAHVIDRVGGVVALAGESATRIRFPWSAPSTGGADAGDVEDKTLDAQADAGGVKIAGRLFGFDANPSTLTDALREAPPADVTDVSFDAQLPSEPLVRALTFLVEASAPRPGIAVPEPPEEHTLPRMERGPARVLGPIDADVITRGLERSDYAFTKCLNERLKSDPQFRDVAEVKLTIGADGKVIHVRAVATDGELSRCIEDALIHREFKDRSADDITTVELTLTFQ